MANPERTLLEGTDLFGTPFPGEYTPKRNYQSIIYTLEQSSESCHYTFGINPNNNLLWAERKAALGRVCRTYWNEDGNVVRTEIYKNGQPISANDYVCDKQKRLISVKNFIYTSENEWRLRTETSFIYPPNKPIDEYTIQYKEEDKKTVTLNSEMRKLAHLNLFLSLDY